MSDRQLPFTNSEAMVQNASGAPKAPRSVIGLLAVAAGVGVAGIYYHQPLLGESPAA